MKKEYTDLIDEPLDEANLTMQEKDHNGLNEAPASANTRIKTKSGRQWQVTMRTASVKELVKQIEMMDDLFDSKGWVVPNWQKEESPAPVEPVKDYKEDNQLPPVNMCRVHHVEMTLKQGKYGQFYSHKTQQGWCNGRPK